MGWNSYNYYGCSPNETIIKANAAGLVDLGFHDAGYDFVTPDCGWSATYRNSTTGELVWDPDWFPSGGNALSDYVHGLGLKFGMYSGAGYYQCGSTDQPASLGHETVDANSFAAWGADALKSVTSAKITWADWPFVDKKALGTIIAMRIRQLQRQTTRALSRVLQQDSRLWRVP